MIHMTEAEFRDMQGGKAPKRSKYGAKRTESGFDSHKEEKRYLQLLILERVGEIKNLARQAPFTLRVNGVVIGKIVIDFVYDTKDGQTVYEDVKAGNSKAGKSVTETPLFRWKAKHFAAQYGVGIEVWK